MSLSPEQKKWVRNLETEGETYLRAANETAFLDEETGEVETDIQGLDRYSYKNIEDFIEHEIKGNFVPHKHSTYIGTRNHETGEIEFNDNYDPQTMTIDEDEDGDAVFSNFIDVKE